MNIGTDSDAMRPIEELGFVAAGRSGNEIFGECPFCGKEGKFYINSVSLQWACKAGACAKSGNLYTFMDEWYKLNMEYDTGDWESLANDRSLPEEVLRASGVVWDGERWIIPVRNLEGNIITFRLYRPGRKIRSLTGLNVGIYNLEKLDGNTKSIYLCEGEWDAMALEFFLSQHLPEEELESLTVFGCPGAETFKDAWVEYFKGKKLTICYDNDEAGVKGTSKVALKCKNFATSTQYLTWPDGMPEGFDVRDFVRMEGTPDVFETMLTQWVDPTPAQIPTGNPVPGHPGQDNIPPAPKPFPKLSSGLRPSFKETLDMYHKWLFMGPDLDNCLKVIYATIISNQINGDPLWIHIAGPPGSAKTELLMSTSTSDGVVAASSLSPKSLVSGFMMAGGHDPSLIPKLIGNVFILKDFTEVLKMNPAAKDEIYSTLRGAFDGEIERPFANGVNRIYKGYFSMLSGVTQEIFSESDASMGDRFLIYHVIKGVGLDSTKSIMAAIRNVGSESPMKSEMQSAAKSFLEFKVEKEDVPVLEDEVLLKITALAQFVGMMRAVIQKDKFKDILLFRPQHEVGTRLGKQLKKLFIGLCLLEYPAQVSEEAFRVVQRVAMDTCNGFNFEIVSALSRLSRDEEDPTKLISWDGRDILEMAEITGMPIQTLKDHLESMVHLGVLVKEKVVNNIGSGFSKVLYSRSPIIKQYWRDADMDKLHPLPPMPPPIPKRRMLEQAEQEAQAAVAAGHPQTSKTKNKRFQVRRGGSEK